jgi:hypothetical protein
MAMAVAVTTVTTTNNASSSSSPPLPSSLLAGGGSRRRSSLFGVATNRPSTSSSSLSDSDRRSSNIRQSLSSILPSILSTRGGDTTTNDIINVDNQSSGESLYFPGLLDAHVMSKGGSSSGGGSSSDPTITAVSDCYISITQSKAKELQLHQGDLVAIIGKRRRCAYVKVNILTTNKTTTTGMIPKSSSSIQLGRNLANNLHIRNDDKVRILSINEIEQQQEEEDQRQQESTTSSSSGSYGLGKRPTNVAKTITLHPIKDTLSNVNNDDEEVSDEELIVRFITPYLDSSSTTDFININNDENNENVAIMKEGHVLTLTDENGIVMEFTIGKLDIHDDNEDDNDEKDETGECEKYIYKFVDYL